MHNNRYTISEEAPYTVEVFYDGSDVPGLRQPFWPNGDDFESIGDATEWAIEFLDSLENEDAPFPRISKDSKREPKPEPEPVPELNTELELETGLEEEQVSIEE
jgi:radical SAM superfamily enzyme YgiQ (UPF0313 family)